MNIIKLLMATGGAGNRLNFDAQTGSFFGFNGVTAPGSGATAKIAGVIDNGTYGTLILTDTVGTFLNNEMIYGHLIGFNPALGAELCANPTFDTDTWWVHDHASLTIAGGNGVYTDAPQYEQFKRNALLTIGKFYKTVVDILNYVEGNILVSPGGVITGADTHTLWAQAAGTSFRLYANGGGTANNYNIDNCSIKEIINAALCDGTVY